jgi:hypothetical protein
MAHIAGVQTKRNADGAIQEIVIDATKHPEAIEALKSMGLIEKSPLQQEIEENPEKFITVEKGFAKVKAEVRKSWEEWNSQQ